MTQFVLIPGAGGAAWVWSRVADELNRRGHDAIAVELPADDESAGLNDYARAVMDAAEGRSGAVIAASSMGAFTAPLVAGQLDAQSIVLLNPMIPLPGETPGQWWENVGSAEARIAGAHAGGYSTEFDVDTYFLHDIPAEVLASAPPPKPQANRPFGDRCDFESWPAPVTVIAARDDRFFPLEFQQRVARERLGVEPIMVPGGHLATVSQPHAVVDALLAPPSS